MGEIFCIHPIGSVKILNVLSFIPVAQIELWLSFLGGKKSAHAGIFAPFGKEIRKDN
jgi:hypothetical protein